MRLFFLSVSSFQKKTVLLLQISSSFRSLLSYHAPLSVRGFVSGLFCCRSFYCPRGLTRSTRGFSLARSLKPLESSPPFALLFRFFCPKIPDRDSYPAVPMRVVLLVVVFSFFDEVLFSGLPFLLLLHTFFPRDLRA